MSHPISAESHYDSPTTTYWRPQEADPSPTYGHNSKSSITHSQPGPVASTPVMSPFGHSEDSPHWQLPPRAMSFSNIESLPRQYSHHQQPNRPDDSRNRHSSLQYPYPHPHTLDTSAAISSSSMPAPLSAPVMGQSMPGFGYPSPVWNQSFNGAVSAQETPIQRVSFSHSWYSDPLHRVEEEQHSPGDGPFPPNSNYFPTPASQGM
jgi:hypothetical protein